MRHGAEQALARIGPGVEARAVVDHPVVHAHAMAVHEVGRGEHPEGAGGIGHQRQGRKRGRIDPPHAHRAPVALQAEKCLLVEKGGAGGGPGIGIEAVFQLEQGRQAPAQILLAAEHEGGRATQRGAHRGAARVQAYTAIYRTG
ncbi:hypothetical protein D3C71_1774560 [compost metagenome]